MAEETKTACEHKWVHMRKTDSYEVGYRRWHFADVFFCEKCLAQKEIETEVKERRSYGGY